MMVQHGSELSSRISFFFADLWLLEVVVCGGRMQKYRSLLSYLSCSVCENWQPVAG